MNTALAVRQSIANAYPYFSVTEIADLYDIALFDYLTLRFPYDRSITDVPIGDERDYVWIRQRMVEIIERSGFSSAVAYSENGLSIRFDNSYMSKGLASKIIPKVGVPK
jgi:hypothetical protein